MTASLESVAMRFFESTGVVEPAGYRTVAVLLDESVSGHFAGENSLLVTLVTEMARHNPEAQLLSYGSPILESIASASLDLGQATHLYFGDLNLTRGRTLEKVRQHAAVPGRILEVGEEAPYLYHHALFRFRVALEAETREEAFYEVATDLHSGWITTALEEAALRLHGSREPVIMPETPVRLCLEDACGKAVAEVERAVATWVRRRGTALEARVREEKEQVGRHYRAIVDRLEAGKARKGANPDRIDDKIQATLEDRERRLEDVDHKYSATVEAALLQLAVVSYPKVTVPLRLLQGKEERESLAVWDPVVHVGYLHTP